jgi:hypothetical protein
MKKIVLLFLIFLGPLSITAQNEYQAGEYMCGEYVALPCAACCGDTTAATLARLYPNPTTDFFQIIGLKSENTEGSLFSIDGRFQKKVKLIGDIDVSDQAQGTYILKIDHSSLIFKFVKI